MRRVHLWLTAALVSACGIGAGIEASRADAQPAPIQPAPCTVEGMMADLRAALKTGSPAYQKYARTWLKEASIGIPLKELQALFQGEKDPAMIEALAAALAARSSRLEDPESLKPVLLRAVRDADPAARAAAVRGLRGIGSVEAMAKVSGLSYTHLLQDPSAEVRLAAADNLVTESAEVYGGHDRTVSEQAVAAALGSSDPAAAAKLLREISMEQVGPETVQRLVDGLEAGSADLRAATATALGGVPASGAGEAKGALLERYRADSDKGVREAILASIVRLEMGGATGTLESLRGVDPAMGAEIDAWLKALRLGLQEWSLVAREKQRQGG